MSWKKFFKPVNSVLPSAQRVIDSTSAYASTAKYSNWLPEVYSGPPDRLQRYAVYDQMNYDHEISAALDTIADFGTESDEVSKLPLIIEFNDEPTPSEIQILEKSLGQWCRLNKLNRRLWRMFRSTLVYGDQFFLRDPESFKLFWIDPAKVEKVIVNESDGKKIESYYVKDIDLNMKSLVATNQLNKLSNEAFGSNSIVFSPPMQGNMNYVSGGYGGAGTANYQDGGATAVDAEHIVQLSLTDGMNAAWPFGLSILEQIYKVYKQKELLEDAILIYRVHRAPERRVFFIDVGTMPPNKAQQYLERIRYEVQQKRIPSRTGGGCFSMDTEVPLLDGRTLSITDLAEEYKSGKENWAYSCDPITGRPLPGLITWAGVTQKSAKVLKLTLDNGEVITCTPEHKFPIIGKGFIEAKDILINDDSMISFNTRVHGINSKNDQISKGNTYHQIFDHSDNTWKYTHRVVAGYMKELSKHNEYIYDTSLADNAKNIIHHMDYNRYNNAPYNLHYMNGYDHFLLHSREYKLYWDSLTDVQKQAIKEKALRTKNLKSEDEKAVESINRSVGDKSAWARLKSTNPEEYKRRIVEKTKNVYFKGKPFSNHYRQYNSRMSEIVCHYIDNGATSKDKILALLSNDTEFMKIYKGLNITSGNVMNKLVLDVFCNSALIGMLAENGFDSWRDLLRNRGKNIQRPSRKLVWDPVMLKILVDDVKNNNFSKINDAYSSIILNAEFMRRYNNLNKNIKGNAKSSKFTASTFRVFLIDHGYKHWADFKEKISLFNHKVVSIEYLNNPMEVGTLTIDNDEKYHNYHTFAIKQGVYTKNSNVVDSTYNPMCLDMNTRVPLLDGRTLSIVELAEEYKTGKENWAYSCDPITGKVVPGPITWAGITRKDARVLKLTFDNGKTLTCTPDHKIPILGKGFVEAKDLTINDSLISYQTQFRSLSGDPNRSYQQVYDHETNRWKFTHRMVAEYFREKDIHNEFIFEQSMAESEKDIVHHIEIVSIEYLDDTIDVGTITIDGKENYHDYHTFAIESGIFVKNSILEDYFFAITSEGRGSKVEVLPGGENLGDIDDLKYFNNKMLRALGVPSSYLPTGPEDGTTAVTDGRVGTAFIQEFRFAKVVTRYQQQVIESLDMEFKLFLKFRGVTIDNSLFELKFTPPQSFSEYRKLELDSARINTFTALTDISFVSKRFILKTYLGWTEEQLAENERMWKEERSRLTKTFAPDQQGMGGGSAPAGLSDVGITSSGIDNMAPDQEDMGDMEDTDAGTNDVSDAEVDNFGNQ